MGFTYRKSKNLGGGVRLNTGKKNIGLSAGVKGAHVSVNSKGRIGLSLGIPGTNFRYRKVMSSKKGGSGFIAAIVNLTWWLLVATIWACCMIFVYLWKFTVLLGKFVVFLGKKLFYLAKKAAARLRRKEIVEE